MRFILLCFLMVSGSAMAQLALDQKNEVKLSTFAPVDTNVKFESRIDKSKSFNRPSAKTEKKINIQEKPLDEFEVKDPKLAKIVVNDSGSRNRGNNGHNQNNDSDNSSSDQVRYFSGFRLSNFNACIAPVNFREQYRQSVKAKNASK